MIITNNKEKKGSITHDKHCPVVIMRMVGITFILSLHHFSTVMFELLTNMLSATIGNEVFLNLQRKLNIINYATFNPIQVGL